MDGSNIVLFDGVCNLCNSSVRFLLRIDKEKVLKYAHLQSDYANKLAGKFKLSSQHFDSVIFIADNTPYLRSKAVFEIFRVIGYPWKILTVFKILPADITDRIYDYISRHRYKWFGRREVCKLPSDELLDRFIQ